jgi:malate dehydrogenase
LEGEYNQEDICIGVPCVIGRSGLESIVDVNLTADEQATFNKSAGAVRNMNAALDSILS